MTPDLLCKGRLEGLQVAFAYVNIPNTASEAVMRHHCDPPAAHLLGRAMAAGLLVASTLGTAERVNIRWTYRGTLKTLLVDAGPDGTCRALITPPRLADTPDVDALTGDGGEIRVIRSAASLVTASGTTRAQMLDVVDDLAMFLCLSDQVESAMKVLVGFSGDQGAPVRVCRGLLLQALPGCDLELFHHIRGVMASTPVLDLIAQGKEEEHLPRKILEAAAAPAGAGHTVRLVHTCAPVFRCSCSQRKMGAVLGALPADERADILAQGRPLSIRCHFCNHVYSLPPDDCARIWQELEDEGRA